MVGIGAARERIAAGQADVLERRVGDVGGGVDALQRKAADGEELLAAAPACLRRKAATSFCSQSATSSASVAQAILDRASGSCRAPCAIRAGLLRCSNSRCRRVRVGSRAA